MTARKTKVLSIALSVLLVLVLVPSMALAADFSDTSSHWGKEAIDTWAGYGVLDGYEDGTFQPNGNMTRAELAKVINGVIGYQVKATNSFSDVTSTNWFEDHVLKLNAAGVMQGSGNALRPNDKITRQEASVMIARAFAIDESTGSSSFSDASSIASWASGLVNGMQAAGYIQGSDNRFNPNTNITRAEVVTILDNMIDAYYQTAGEYGEDTSTAVSGNVVVSAAGITVKNMAITGNLYLTDGIASGDVTVKGSSVAGKTLVWGGGGSSDHFDNCKLSELVVNRNGSAVRAILSNGTTVDLARVDENDILEVQNGILVTRAVLNKGAILDIKSGGRITTVDVQGDSEVANAGTITTMNVDAPVNVTGTGTITTANVNVSGSVFAKAPTNLNLASGVSATVAGKLVTASTTTTGGGGGGGGGGVTTSATITSLTITDENTATLILGRSLAITSNDIIVKKGATYDTATVLVAGTDYSLDGSGTTYTITLNTPLVGGNILWVKNSDSSSLLNERAEISVTANKLTAVGAITGTVKIGETLTAGALTYTGGTPSSPTISYQWNADSEPISGATGSTYVIQGSDAGKVITVTAKATGTAFGSATSAPTATVPYTILLSVSGATGTDAASLNSAALVLEATGDVSDTIAITYTLDNTDTTNLLTFGGVGTPPARVIAAATGGSASYTVAATDAVDGVITITAAFEHSNLTLGNISYATSSVTKVYGDSDSTNTLAETAVGSDAVITYSSNNPNVATVDSDGKVTIVGVGNAIITAIKAADSTHTSAQAQYTLTVNGLQLTTSSAATVTTAKVYDGTTTAAVTNPGTLAGVVTGDNVTLSATAAYANKDVATDKTITITYTISGSKAANYIAPVDDSTTYTGGVITTATPTVPVYPTATAVISGQALSTSTISGGVVNGVTGESNLAGAWAWDDGTTTVSATGKFKAVFAPTSLNYKEIEVEITVSLRTAGTDALVTGIAGLTDAEISAVADNKGTITSTEVINTAVVNLTATVSTDAVVSYWSDAACTTGGLTGAAVTAHGLTVGENLVYIKVVNGTIENIYTVNITRKNTPVVAVKFAADYEPMVYPYADPSNLDFGYATGIYYVGSNLVGVDGTFDLTVSEGWVPQGLTVGAKTDNADGTVTYTITPDTVDETLELEYTDGGTTKTYDLHLLQVADLTVTVEGAGTNDKVELIGRAQGVTDSGTDRGQNNPSGLGGNGESLDVTAGDWLVYDLNDYLIVDVTLGTISTGATVTLFEGGVEVTTPLEIESTTTTATRYIVQLDASAMYELKVTFTLTPTP